MMGSALDVLRNQIQDAEPVLKRLDLEMERIEFDPHVPASVEAAKVTVDTVIDRLMGAFRKNPILGPLADDLKSQYLEGIATQVAEARGQV
jgi:hypothetical protein